MQELTKEWRQSDCGRQRMKEHNEYRRMHKFHEITEEEWIDCKDFFDNSCAYCGLSEAENIKLYGQQLHKEHFDHDGSNGIDNCIPSCKSCNSSKGTKIFEEWFTGAEENKEKIYAWLNLFV